LILGKIIKIVATRCHILKLQCTKFDFGWGSTRDPAGGAYSAPPDPLAGYRGGGLLLRERMGGRTGEKGKGGEKRGKGTYLKGGGGGGAGGKRKGRKGEGRVGPQT